MINGFHSLVYSIDADATRAFFRDVLEWPNLDVGGGWLIFKTPPSELGVHPTQNESSEPGEARPNHNDASAQNAGLPLHQVSIMCDDIEATLVDLRAKGVAIKGDVVDEGFGLVTSIDVPGAGWMQLYEPRHEVAHSL